MKKILIAGLCIPLAFFGMLIAGLLGIKGNIAQACQQQGAYLQPVDTAVSTAVAFNRPEQQANARTIKGIGVARKLPYKARLLAIMVAMQESRLYNLPGGDWDSIGIFQQRPSQGWGTAQQIKDPVYATNKFYDALERVDGWESMTLLDAALAVQRPSRAAYLSKNNYFPGWEDDARVILGEESPIANTDDGVLGSEASMPMEGCAQVGVGGNVEFAVQAALSQQGKPYVYGSGPSTTSFDCSDLMQYAYSKAGVDLPRDSRSQFRYGEVVPEARATSGTPTSWQAALKRGDLVFWGSDINNVASISHVAMYLGNGQIIDAPSPGKVVSVKPIYWAFGSLKYFGATRPAPAVNPQSVVREGWQFPLRSITVTSPYGMRVHPITKLYKLHDGVDFRAVTGTPVYAANNGVVKSANFNKAYGNFFIINHGGGVETAYAHLSSFAPGLRAGTQVHKGQQIGLSGSTGYSTAPHLHFMVYLNGKPSSPLKFLREQGLVP